MFYYGYGGYPPRLNRLFRGIIVMEGFIWLGLIILGVVIEAASPQLVAIWFVLGAVGALISSFCGAEIWLQVVIAIAISVISLAATRPLAKKFLTKKVVKTNADRVIGSEGIVTTEINDVEGKGRVTVMGSSWSAFSSNGKSIPANAKIIVEAIEGVKLSVKLKED